LERDGFDIERLARLAQAMRVFSEAVNAAASALIAAAAKIDETILVSRAGWAGPRAARQRALSVLLVAAAGADREPAPELVAQLEARFLEHGYRGETLGGAKIEAVAGGVRLSRDPGAVLGRHGGGAPLIAIDLPLDEEVIWDGRYALTAAGPGMQVAGAPQGSRYFALGVGAAEVEPQVQVRALLREHVRHRLGGDFAVKF
jgi:hypothetical protein